MSLRPLRAAVERWQPILVRADDPLSVIAVAWPQIVGARAAQHSAPLELSGDVLVVATRSSAWSQQLQLLEPQLLAGLREVAGRPLRTLRFRTGLPRVGLRGGGVAPPPAAPRRPASPAPDPAIDQAEAFERLRRRVGVARRRARTTCERCGAPTDRADVCAPCRGAEEASSAAELQRILFNMPWLSFGEVRAIVAGLTEERYESVRRALLQRWWTLLERARRAGRPLSRRERQIASSYVLLQSGLAPDRITPAVVRNLLGAELESQLSGAATAN
jgi:hypothetical protein